MTVGFRPAVGTGNLSLTGTLAVAGTESPSGGINTSAHAAVTNPVPVSGTPFTPSATFDTFVGIEATTAAAAGTLTVTYGPTTGTENTWMAAGNVVVGESLMTSLMVPAGWKVVATTTGVGVTLSSAVHRI